MTDRTRYSVGDIIMIPIDDSFFVFGQILNDAAIRVFDFCARGVVELSDLKDKEILIECGVFDTNIVNGKWQVIGSLEFSDPEQCWAAPSYSRDILDESKYRIYFKGRLLDASEQEVDGLDEQVMYKPEGLISEVKKRLMNRK